MTLAAKPINKGALSSVLYDFATVGDTLPMHDHTEATAHLTAVMRGAAICRGPGNPPAWTMTLVAPEIYDLPPGAHEIEATEAATRIWNVVKGVSPAQTNPAETLHKAISV